MWWHPTTRRIWRLTAHSTDSGELTQAHSPNRIGSQNTLHRFFQQSPSRPRRLTSRSSTSSGETLGRTHYNPAHGDDPDVDDFSLSGSDNETLCQGEETPSDARALHQSVAERLIDIWRRFMKHNTDDRSIDNMANILKPGSQPPLMWDFLLPSNGKSPG